MPDQHSQSSLSATDLAATALQEVEEQEMQQQEDEVVVKPVGEASASSSTRTSDSSSNAITSLAPLQQVIERNAAALDEVIVKLRELKEQLVNVYENDTELTIAQEDVVRVAESVKNRRAQLQNGPQVMQLKVKITDVAEQKKEIEEALNNHLLNLYKMTGTKVVDLSTGEREFTVRASLKRKKQG